MNGRIVALLTCFTALTACDQNSEIKVYRVAKAPLEEESSAPQNAMPANAPSPSMPGGMAPAATTESVPVPPNWEAQPLSQMRQASFLVKGQNGAMADISFVSLGVSAGNVLDNVNRWLSQLGQPAIEEQRLSQVSQRLITSVGEVTVVDLIGLPQGADPAKDGRIVAAMTSSGSSTLFFKMRGNAALVESQKGEFVKWVTAISNSKGGNKSPQAAGAMPMDKSGKPQIKWQIPEGWKEVPASSMRYASFSVGDGDAKIDISIVVFPGDGGSDLDNINRWREQLALPPMSEAAVASQVSALQTPDATFASIDIAGPKVRTLAAWVRRDARVWFFKATGPNTAIEKEKSSFVKFIQSIRF